MLAMLVSPSFGAELKLQTPFEAVAEKLLAQNHPRKSKIPPSQIILGSAVPFNSYPFPVSLIAASVARGQESEGHFCGGSLIGATWVLTAAHCVTSNRELIAPHLIDVYAGSSDFSGGDRISVKTIIRHPDFVLEYFENDLALLELAREPDAELRRTNRTGLIDIADPRAESELAKPGTAATILGWGTTEKSDFSGRLHAASVQIIDRKQCNGNILEKRAQDLENELSNIARSFRIDRSRLQNVEDAIMRNAGPLVSDGMFCAGDPGTPVGTRVADACRGDSGGPIFVTTKGGSHVQVGVISWGEGCGLPKLYGVYARLAAYADWIAAVKGEPVR
jgi:secreted trypsin-like serine protease